MNTNMMETAMPQDENWTKVIRPQRNLFDLRPGDMDHGNRDEGNVA